MQEKTEHIIELYKAKILGTITPEESQELDEWISENPSRRDFDSLLSDAGYLAENYRKRSLINPENARRQMKMRLGIGKNQRLKILSVGAAAAVICGFVILLSVFLTPDSIHQETLSQAVNHKLQIDSLFPGETMAYMINGTEKTPITPELGSSTVSMQNLRETSSAMKSPVVLEVPRGGEFTVILDDSTKVWLNSASVLTYPENFSKTSRKVKISGEAYFAVTKDIDKNPFIVECEGQQVTVYGTEFNIRSYPEEKNVLTSLAKGSVAVKRADETGGELLISPGTQSVFNKDSKTATTKKVNIETITGWRNGRFVFEEQTLEQIMYDLGRWYDFEFEFETPDLKEVIFMGSIPRYADFSTAMLILEKSGDVAFTVFDNKIRVEHKKP